MSPEQVRGEELDARSDVFSFGTVLYEMATARQAFAGTTTGVVGAGKLWESLIFDAILHRAPTAPVRLNPEVPQKLEEIIHKALEKDRELRYQRAAEIGTDLKRLKRGTDSGGHAAPTTSKTPVPPRPVPAEQVSARGAGLLRAAGPLASDTRPRAVARRGRKARPGRIKALAVLPLENLSRDPEQEYFADGMTEALITDLAQIGALRVISRTSVMQYKGVRKPLPQIARELNVEAVVEGSVLRSGDRVRITAQLIHAATDQHLWAKSYERDLRDILALQSEVARAIAQEIQIKLTPQERARLASARPVNPEVHEAYLRGVYYFNKFTDEGFRKASDCWRQALEKDPGYALAYAALATYYCALAAFSALPNEAYPRAKAAAMKAVELDDMLAEAHSNLGLTKLHYDLDWSGAEREIQRAMELNPGLAIARHHYIVYLWAMGRLEQALREAKRAQELDPLSAHINADLGWTLFFAGRFDQSIKQFQKVLEFDPNFWMLHWGIGLGHQQKGRFEEAIAELGKAVSLSGGNTRSMASLAYAYAVAGERGKALKIRDQLNELSKRIYVPSFDMAVVYIGLGEKDEAFTWLGRAYEERFGWLIFLRVIPWFDSLRDDPRFQDLVRRMNFPE